MSCAPDTRRLKNTASAVDAPSLTFPWSTSGGENSPLFGQPGAGPKIPTAAEISHGCAGVKKAPPGISVGRKLRDLGVLLLAPTTRYPADNEWLESIHRLGYPH
eukprot:symbB.v1.2.005643.t1/scaffold331.1/size227729/3